MNRPSVSRKSLIWSIKPWGIVPTAHLTSSSCWWFPTRSLNYEATFLFLEERSSYWWGLYCSNSVKISMTVASRRAPCLPRQFGLLRLFFAMICLLHPNIPHDSSTSGSIGLKYGLVFIGSSVVNSKSNRGFTCQSTAAGWGSAFMPG